MLLNEPSPVEETQIINMHINWNLPLHHFYCTNISCDCLFFSVSCQCQLNTITQCAAEKAAISCCASTISPLDGFTDLHWLCGVWLYLMKQAAVDSFTHNTWARIYFTSKLQWHPVISLPLKIIWTHSICNICALMMINHENVLSTGWKK